MKESENKMRIVVDSREQIRWKFSDKVETVEGSLPTADYSLLNLEDYVAIERKEMSDFVACCGKERARFKRELHRMQSYRVKAVIVESSWDEICCGQYRSQIKPESIIGSVASWTTKYNIQFMFASNAKRAAQYCEALCRNYLQLLQSIDKAVKENGG